MTTLECAVNFRDLSGHRTRDGRTIGPGRLYRSGVLCDPSPRDQALIRAIGFGVVCDLRSGAERSPAREWPYETGTKRVSMPLSLETRSNEVPMLRMLIDDPTAAGARNAILATYREMPQGMRRHLPTLFDHLLAADSAAVLIHCRFGKDRTGFVCALVLLALGVPLATVLEDYERSNANIDAAALAAEMARDFCAHGGRIVDPAAMLPLAQTHRDYLEASLAQLARDYGSLPRYLRDHAALSRGKLRALRNKYLI